MPTMNEIMAHPEFKTLNEQQAVKALAQADDAPRVANEGPKIGPKNTSLSEPPATVDERDITRRPKPRGFIDRFAPTALLKGAGEQLGNLTEMSMDNPLVNLVNPMIPGMKMLKDEFHGSQDRLTQYLTRAYEKQDQGDLLGSQWEAGKGVAAALPVVGSLVEPADEVLTKGNTDFLPDLLAEGANALLPKVAGKMAPAVQRSANKSFTKALGPRTGAAAELLEDAVPSILRKEEGLASLSPRSLEEKLYGNGANIQDARRELRVAKHGLSDNHYVDPTPMLDAADNVGRAKELKGTWHEEGIPADFDYNSRAQNAKGIVTEKAPHMKRHRMKGINPDGSAKTVPMFSESDYQTLTETIQDRARRGKVYDKMTSGELSPESISYGQMASAGKDQLASILPKLGRANERVHNLLTAGEVMHQNRMGPIRPEFAGPSGMSVLHNPVMAAGAELLSGHGRLANITTPWRTSSAVTKTAISQYLEKVAGLSPYEAMAIADAVSDDSMSDEMQFDE